MDASYETDMRDELLSVHEVIIEDKQEAILSRIPSEYLSIVQTAYDTGHHKRKTIKKADLSSAINNNSLTKVSTSVYEPKTGKLKASSAIIIKVSKKKTDWTKLLGRVSFPITMMQHMEKLYVEPTMIIGGLFDVFYIYVLDEPVWFNSKKMMTYYKNVERFIKKQFTDIIRKGKSNPFSEEALFYKAAKVEVVDHMPIINSVCLETDMLYGSVESGLVYTLEELLPYQVKGGEFKPYANLLNFNPATFSSENHNEKRFAQRKAKYPELYAPVINAHVAHFAEFRYVALEEIAKYLYDNDGFTEEAMNAMAFISATHEQYCPKYNKGIKFLHYLNETYFNEPRFVVKNAYNDAKCKVIDGIQYTNETLREMLGIEGSGLDNYLMYSEGDINLKRFKKRQRLNKAKLRHNAKWACYGLRKNGRSFEQISLIVGIPKSTARLLVKEVEEFVSEKEKIWEKQSHVGRLFMMSPKLMVMKLSNVSGHINNFHNSKSFVIEQFHKTCEEFYNFFSAIVLDE